MENWVRQWEEYLGVAPRLSEFFGSSGGRELLKKARQRQKRQVNFDPEVFAFILWFFVWPGEELKKFSKVKDLKEASHVFRKAKRIVEKLQGNAVFGNPEELQLLFQRLGNLHKVLSQIPKHLQGGGFFPVKIGKIPIHIKGPISSSKRHLGKRGVVYFLTGYFRKLRCEHPDWEIIWDFLKEAGLEKDHSDPKRLATWWSNVRKREGKEGPTLVSFPGNQESFLILFEYHKEVAWKA